MNREVFLSILAMDAYQRGYAPGVAGLSTPAFDSEGNATSVIKIGNATITHDSSSLVNGNLRLDQPAGFYALSYTLDSAWAGLAAGTTVVSYRGTDFDAANGGKFIASEYYKDLRYGWTTFLTAGLPAQFPLARDFFKAVTVRDFSDGTPAGDAVVANTIVTGHSLGGALAAANDDCAIWNAAA